MVNLTKSFDLSRESPSGKTLDELRQDYYIEANMKGIDDASIGGLQINTSGRKSAALLQKHKQQQATNDLILLADLQRQLDNITNNMIDKYGEDFAAQFAAEFLDEKVFADIMQIEDDQARRAAFAKAINDGIKNGTINAEDIHKNTDFTQWLTKHDELNVAIANTPIEISSEQTYQVANQQDLAQGLDDLFSPS